MNSYLNSLTMDIFDVIGYGKWCWQPQNDFFECDALFSKILNLQSNCTLMSNFYQTIYSLDRKRVVSSIQEAVTSHESFTIEFRSESFKSDKYFSLLGQYKFLENKPIVYFGVLKEVTAERQVILRSQNYENNLKQAQRVAGIGSWSYDLVKKEIYCDESMHEMLGIPLQEKITFIHELQKYITSQEWLKNIKTIKRYVMHRKEGGLEYKIFTKNNELKDIFVFFEYEYNEFGLIKALHGIVQDVSRQRFVHDQLKWRINFGKMIGSISSKFINLKSSHIGDGIKVALEEIGKFFGAEHSFLFLAEKQKQFFFKYQWFYDLNDGDYSLWGPCLSSDCSVLFDTILNKDFLFIDDVDALDSKYEIEKKYFVARKVSSIICLPMYLEGKVIGGFGFDSSQVMKAWRNEDLEILNGCCEIFVNALNRKKIEEEMRKGEEYLQFILNSIDDMLIVLDENKKITNFNRALGKLTNYSAQELFNKDVAEILVYNKKSEDDIYARLLCKQEPNYACNFWGCVTKEGKIFPLSIQSSRINNKELELFGTVVVCRETTAQLQLEEQLRHSEKMRVIGQLSGGVAHDFNNLLTGIMGCASILKKRLEEPSGLLVYVENILSTSRRAANLTSQLLAFSRFEKPKYIEIDVHKVLLDAINFLKRAIDPKILICLNLNADKFIVEGDESQLHNVFLNLALNSRDAMPNGGKIEFNTTSVEMSAKDIRKELSLLKPGKYLKICVKDNGHGMPREIFPHIFEPFFTTKEKGKGTGLGLPAVYGTILSHQGVILVDSEVNQFTEFTIFLPLAITQSVQQAVVTDVNIGQHGSKQIMIVDDELLLSNLMSEMLLNAGFSPIVAQSGSDAILRIKHQKHKIDLVLVDMLMPNMNGIELLQQIYQIQPDIKAIIISGFSGGLDLKGFLKEKDIPFLQKPFEEKQLLQMVYQILKD